MSAKSFLGGNLERLVSLLGIFAFLGICYALSENKSAIQKKIVFWGMGLQLVFALLVLGVPALGIPGPLRGLFAIANNVVNSFLNFTNYGTQFIFGSLADPSKTGFVFAINVLPTIVFFSSIMAVMYHLGVMQKIIRGIAIVMHRFMKVSGAEALATAAEIFVGQTESPLMIKPYVNFLTRSEIYAVMVGGMATVAGGVMAAYVGLLRDRIPDIAGHLLTASVLAAPAALIVAKLILPETEKPLTMGGVPDDKNKIDSNVVEAAARGAGEGLHLALNVGVMLLAFIALVALLNGILSWFGHLIHFENWGAGMVHPIFKADGNVELTLQMLLGWLFSPIAWLMGVPFGEITAIGSLLGEKVVLNEFVAYQHLSTLGTQLSDRSMIIASYALCGFANFSSIAIQIGGTGSLAPDRRSEIAKLGMRAVIGGSLASFITAAIAGLLI